MLEFCLEKPNIFFTEAKFPFKGIVLSNITILVLFTHPLLTCMTFFLLYNTLSVIVSILGVSND